MAERTHKTTIAKRLLSFALAVVMVLSLLPAGTVTVSAAGKSYDLYVKRQQASVIADSPTVWTSNPQNGVTNDAAINDAVNHAVAGDCISLKEAEVLKDDKYEYPSVIMIYVEDEYSHELFSGFFSGYIYQIPEGYRVTDISCENGTTSSDYYTRLASCFITLAKAGPLCPNGHASDLSKVDQVSLRSCHHYCAASDCEYNNVGFTHNHDEDSTCAYCNVRLPAFSEPKVDFSANWDEDASAVVWGADASAAASKALLAVGGTTVYVINDAFGKDGVVNVSVEGDHQASNGSFTVNPGVWSLAIPEGHRISAVNYENGTAGAGASLSLRLIKAGPVCPNGHPSDLDKADQIGFDSCHHYCVVDECQYSKGFYDEHTVGEACPYCGVVRPESLDNYVCKFCLHPANDHFENNVLVVICSQCEGTPDCVGKNYAQCMIPYVAVAGVSLGQDPLPMLLGETATITPVFEPANASDQRVTWESNNTDVVTVEDGVVTAVKTGTATITVTTNEGGFTATREVAVAGPGWKRFNQYGMNLYYRETNRNGGTAVKIVEEENDGEDYLYVRCISPDCRGLYAYRKGGEIWNAQDPCVHLRETHPLNDDYLTALEVWSSHGTIVAKQGGEMDLNGVQLRATEVNGRKEYINVKADMISGFDNTTVGPQTLSVTIEGKTATLPGYVTNGDIYTFEITADGWTEESKNLVSTVMNSAKAGDVIRIKSPTGEEWERTLGIDISKTGEMGTYVNISQGTPYTYVIPENYVVYSMELRDDATDGADVFYCKIADANAIPADSITFGKSDYYMVLGDSLTLDYTLTPANAIDDLKWSTNSAIVGAVKGGVITIDEELFQEACPSGFTSAIVRAQNSNTDAECTVHIGKSITMGDAKLTLFGNTMNADESQVWCGCTEGGFRVFGGWVTINDGLENEEQFSLESVETERTITCPQCGGRMTITPIVSGGIAGCFTAPKTYHWRFAEKTEEGYVGYMYSQKGQPGMQYVLQENAFNDCEGQIEDHVWWIMTPFQVPGSPMTNYTGTPCADEGHHGHVHSGWEFSAEGAELRAHCTGTEDVADCPAASAENGMTLTLTATSPNYAAGVSDDVTYTLAGGTTLSTANLGEATVVNSFFGSSAFFFDFIPYTSGSCGNDAQGFVDALNAAKYDGYDSWELSGTGWLSFYGVDKNSISTGDVQNIWISQYTTEDWSSGEYNYQNDPAVGSPEHGFLLTRSGVKPQIVNLGKDDETMTWMQAGLDFPKGIHYVGRGDTVLEATTTEPTTVGTYTAIVYLAGQEGVEGKAATIDFEILPAPVTQVSVTGVTLDQETASMIVGGDTLTLTATVAPENATNKNVTWESDNTDVATVEDGVVTAVAPGTATITVKTEDGEFTATCTVTVTAIITSRFFVALDVQEIPGMEKPTATVTVADKTYTVTMDEPLKEVVGEIQVGTKVTLTANSTADATFVRWQTEKGILLSENAEYTYEVSEYNDAVAVYRVAGQTVTFTDRKGNVLSSRQYPASAMEADITVANAPVAYGYEFKGWKLEGTDTAFTDDAAMKQAIWNEIVEERDVILNPVYEALPEQYTVTVTNGSGSGTYDASTALTINADEAPEGQYFAGWYDGDTLLSTNTSYGFYVTADRTLEASFDSAPVEAVGTTRIETVAPNTSTKKISFVSVSSVPTDCKIEKAGVIATSNATVGTNAQKFTAATAAYVRYGTTTAYNYNYTWTKGSVTADQTWYVRAYLVYKDANGNSHTVYGDIVAAKLDGIDG